MLPAETLAEAIAYLEQLSDVAPLAVATRQLSELAVPRGNRIVQHYPLVQLVVRPGRPFVDTNFENDGRELVSFPKDTVSAILGIALRNCVIDAYCIVCACRGDPAECCAATILQAVRGAAAIKRIQFHLCCFAGPSAFEAALEEGSKLTLT
ncbi:hypothetical protein AAVH_39381, partial [Aphelenchoides avenae]